MFSSSRRGPRLATRFAPSRPLIALVPVIAALVLLSEPMRMEAQGSTPDQIGQWSPIINLPMVALHLVVMPTGKVFMMSSQTLNSGSGALVWDPAAPTVFIDATTPRANHFCAGHTLLADGRILITGGDLGQGQGMPDADIYDPFTQTWTDAAAMTLARWYPTNTLLGDGRVLVMGGTNEVLQTVSIQEVYDPLLNLWSRLPASANMPYEYYPVNFVLPDGRLLVAGAYATLEQTRTFNTTTNTWTTIDNAQHESGSSVMYQPGKILSAGSRAYLQGAASIATAHTLDMNTASPAWQTTGSMVTPRAYHTLTMLPDGQVLVTGGTKNGGKSDFAANVHQAEIWNPATGIWSPMASAVIEQGYHSSAVLLPDGRVFASGQGRSLGLSDPDPNDQKFAQTYSPPYLFKGPRPVITSAPSTISLGQSFSVGTPDAASIGSVVLISLPAVTHGFNENQHFVPLTSTVVAGGLSLTAPADANLAPPGYYMLFILNAAGVPSVAPIVRILPVAADTQAPTAPGSLVATPRPGMLDLNWAPSVDNVGVTAYNVHRSTSAGFTPGIPNRIAQTPGTAFTDKSLPTGGTFYYRVTAQDAKGNISALSNQASASPLQTVVPNVGNLTQAAAATSITGAGLTLGAVTTASSGTVAPGHVISQNPAAGATASAGAAVALTIATPVPVLTTILITPTSVALAPGGMQQFTAVAKDQSGTALATQPAFTWTVNGGGTISASGLFTAGGVLGGPFTVAATSAGISGVGPVTIVASGALTIGQPGEFAFGGGGDANNIEGIPATLGQAATILSLAANFRSAAGQVTLSLYADNGSNYPGALKAQTLSFTPAVGWNTQNVIAPVALPPGQYWLMWQANNNGLGISYNPGNVGVGKSNPYGPPPTAFPAGGGVNSDNSIYATLYFGSTGAIPTVATAAKATPASVSGTLTALSVLGADDGGQAVLSYTWTTTGTPPGDVTFGANGTNAAKNTTAVFSKAGTYTLQVTIKDVTNLTATSSVTVTVVPTPTSIIVSPASASLPPGATQQFTASAKDQFGVALAPQPAMSWTVSGGGTIDGTGLLTAGATVGGPFTVTATSGAISNTAAVTIVVPNVPPTVATPAAATPGTVTGTTTALSVLGADNGGEAVLTYTWATTGTPPAAVTFGPNGTNAAKNTTAIFTKIGTYALQVTIKDTGNLTVTSNVTVTVNPTFANIAVTPASASVLIGATQAFAASAQDQFGTPLASQPAITWSVTGGGTINTSGLFTAGATVGGPFTVTATSGAMNGTASVSVVVPNTPPTVATAAAASPSTVTGTTTALNVLGADNGGEAALTYTWATTGTPPAAVTFSANGTNAAKNTTATFTKVGSYTFQVTIKDAGNLTVTSTVTVTVNPALTSIGVTPASASVVATFTQQFTATAKDQFATALASQPAFAWSVSGGGTINSSGLFTAGAAGGGPFTVTATSGGINGTAAVTVVVGGNLTIGQTAVLNWAGSGDANYLQGIPATLGQTATIQSLSVNYKTAAGHSTLSIYADTGSNYPGVLKAQTASFTPVVGWNTQSVTTPVSLSPGKYWLIWQADNNGLGIAYAGGTGVAKSNPYGAPPATFPSGGGANNDNSIYATLSIGPSNAAPTVATPASATPSPVTGATTALSALGADDAGEPALTYTWATTGTPPAAVTFSANGTNAAKTTTATFTKAGSYSFQVTIKDAGNLTATSPVTVTVNATLTSITVTPASASIGNGSTQSFAANAKDQFGTTLASQPAITWAVDAGGTISGAGLFTANLAGGPYTVTATSGSVNGTALVTVTPVNAAPTVGTPAASTPNPVVGTTATLSVLGNDDAGEPALTYTWATTGTPPAAVTFGTNGTNAAKNTTATFTKAGSYSFQVTIKDAGNLTVTSAVTVTVNATLTSITVTPASASIGNGSTQSFTANAKDQFGTTLAPQPAINWTVNGGGGIDGAGLFAANAVGGPFTVTATSGAVSGTASVTVTPVNAAPTVATSAAATPSPVIGTTSVLSVLGADDAGEPALTYTWATTGTPPAAVTFSANGTNAAQNTTATFTKAGSYSFQVTIKDAGNLTATSNVTVTVNATLTSITVTPASASIGNGSTQSFTASAKDQFGTALAAQPAINWTVDGGGGIDGAGLFAANAVGGPFTVTATSGAVSGTASVTVTPVNAAPTVATPAAVTPSPVVGTTAALSALGADDAGEPALTYTWATTGAPPAPVTFGTNGTNAAQNTTATFTKAGSYSFFVTIKDAGNLTATSTVTVTVNATLTSITVTPASASIGNGSTQSFTANAKDQFGATLAPQPAINWTVNGGGGIDAAGLFTANAAGGPFTVTATSGAVSGTASVTVTPVNAAPTVATAASASPSPVVGTTAALSVLGADDAGEPALTYTWATTGTPPAAVTFGTNGTNAAKNMTATFTKAGSYSFQVTIKDAGNLTATSSVTVTVSQTLTTVTVTPATASVSVSGTQQFTASAKDQFAAVLTTQPSFTWAVTGGGSISATGLFTAGATAGGPFTVTAASAGKTGAANVTVTPAGAVAYVQGAASTNNGGDTKIPQAFTTANAAGNLIVVAVSWGSNSSVSCADTQGNTYVVATTQYDSVNNQSLAICYAANIKAGANTVTATFGAASEYRRVLVHEYRGVALANPVDVVAKNVADGTTAANAITSTAAVTTTNGELIFGAVMDDNSKTTVTAGTGFTQRLSVNAKDLVSEDMVQAVAGSVAATHTFGAAHRYLAQMVTFKTQ